MADPKRFVGPYDMFIGELWPGAYGWLPLDSFGVAVGNATILPPPGPDAIACSVMANPSVPLKANDHMLLTPTGATLSHNLNNSIDRRYEIESQYKSPSPPPDWDPETYQWYEDSSSDNTTERRSRDGR